MTIGRSIRRFFSSRRRLLARIAGLEVGLRPVVDEATLLRAISGVKVEDWDVVHISLPARAVYPLDLPKMVIDTLKAHHRSPQGGVVLVTQGGTIATCNEAQMASYGWVRLERVDALKAAVDAHTSMALHRASCSECRSGLRICGDAARIVDTAARSGVDALTFGSRGEKRRAPRCAACPASGVWHHVEAALDLCESCRAKLGAGPLAWQRIEIEPEAQT